MARCNSARGIDDDTLDTSHAVATNPNIQVMGDK